MLKIQRDCWIAHHSLFLFWEVHDNRIALKSGNLDWKCCRDSLIY